MRVTGIIAEYNPFHKGHEYHINEARRLTGADFVIVVMSGNFVQRGTPAIMDKYIRTSAALRCGADAVIELPAVYSCASAEFFAEGSIQLLNKLGIVNYLCFGSECGNIEQLRQIAAILADEPEVYKTCLKDYCKAGFNFPAARDKALAEYLKSSDKFSLQDQKLLPEVIKKPNNLLAIEYLKMLKKTGSQIEPITIQRIGEEYNSEKLDEFSSASALRLILEKTDTDITAVENHFPASVSNIYRETYKQCWPIISDDFSLLLNYKLMQENVESLTNYMDITSDIANRIYNLNSAKSSFTNYSEAVKNKNLTLTRVNRILIHILLNITCNDVKSYSEAGSALYARLLGFRRESSQLLRYIGSNSSIPVINKLADAEASLSPLAMHMLREDVFASHLYNQVVYSKYTTILKNEYTHGIIII